jgi:hypothetical protein
MPNQTYYGLNIYIGSDIASTALEESSNQNVLDAAAGHVWQTATATNAESVWLTVNAVSPSATTATAKAATSSAAIAISALGVLSSYVTPSGTAGGKITWGSSFFTVSPTATDGSTGAAITSPLRMTSNPVTISGTGASLLNLSAGNNNPWAIIFDRSDIGQGGDIRCYLALGGTLRWADSTGANLLDVVSGTGVNLKVYNALSIGTNPAGTGAIRTANAQYHYGRNAANSADLALVGVDGSNQVILGDANNANALIETAGAIGFFGGGSQKWTLGSDGGLYSANATGGDKGNGSVNAANLYVNGTAVLSAPTMFDKKASANGTDYSTTSGSYANVDGTNLAITTTVPTGSKLYVCAAFTVGSSGGTHQEAVRLQDTSAGVTLQEAAGLNAFAFAPGIGPAILEGVVAGDGASHTVALQFAQTSAGTTLIRNQSNNYAKMYGLLVQSN